MQSILPAPAPLMQDGVAHLLKMEDTAHILHRRVQDAPSRAASPWAPAPEAPSTPLLMVPPGLSLHGGVSFSKGFLPFSPGPMTFWFSLPNFSEKDLNPQPCGVTLQLSPGLGPSLGLNPQDLCYGLICVPSNRWLKSCPPEPQDVTVFGDRAFTKVVELK